MDTSLRTWCRRSHRDGIRSGLATVALVSIAALVACTPAGDDMSGSRRSIEQSPPPVIGSASAGQPTSDPDSGQQELDTAPAVVFHEVSATEVESTIARVRPKTAGPFDASRFGFDRLDVYMDRTLPSLAERSPLSGSNATLRLVLAARRGNASRYWILLEQDQDRPFDEGTVSTPLLVDDQPGRDEQVQYATGNRTLPVIDVQYRASAQGANTIARFARHLLIDVRSGTPRVMGLLQDYFIEGGGGACGAFDMTHSTSQEIGCRWNDRDDGFRCAETIHRRDTEWARRRATRTLTFGSLRPISDPSPTAGLVRLAEQAAQQRETDAHIDPLGRVVAVHVSRLEGAALVVMASPLVTRMSREPFGVRLHVATVRTGRATAVSELTPRASLRQLIREESAGGTDLPTPAPGFVPDSVPPSYAVRPLVSDRRSQIVQLTVTEGAARGVYLIGLERDGERITADAFLVATDAITYEGCNEWETEPTAVGMQLTPQPFSAVLDVEPPNRADSGGAGASMFVRDSSRPCRSRVTVDWRNGEGFRATAIPLRCERAEPPRRVVVGTDGALSSVAAKVVPREP